ncbi:MAG TPA: hypothetical protein VF637_08815 [Sphingomicrobium sp.]|jgi:hypothetical protein
MDGDIPTIETGKRRWSWRLVAMVSVVAFVAGLIVTGLGLSAYQRWATPTKQAAPTAPVAETSGFSPRAPLGVSAGAGDYEALASRETALAGQIAELEARLGATDLAAQKAAGNAGRAEGLLVAFAARRALDRGLGLGYLEGQLRDRFGATQPQAVSTVIAAARQPVTLEDLREGIERIGPELATGNTTDGWWASFRREMSGLVVIRRDSAPSPRPTDRLERARRMLVGGQVEAALAEVARLPGAASGDRWIDAARRYIEARGALDTIEAAAIQSQGRDPFTPAAIAPAAPPRAADPVTGAPLGE